mmetsp:Transcript_6821/g.25461  ORF Transcript_6821/g.25461 Transcript_6821/m.25461 type:complete len:411 (-) Transcript_6821:3309-4541(-)
MTHSSLHKILSLSSIALPKYPTAQKLHQLSQEHNISVDILRQYFVARRKELRSLAKGNAKTYLNRTTSCWKPLNDSTRGLLRKFVTSKRFPGLPANKIQTFSLSKQELDHLEIHTQLPRTQISSLVHFYAQMEGKTNISDQSWSEVRECLSNNYLMKSSRFPKHLIDQLQRRTQLNRFQLRYMIRVLRDRDGMLTSHAKDRIFEFFTRQGPHYSLTPEDYDTWGTQLRLSRRQISYLRRKWIQKYHTPLSIPDSKSRLIVREALIESTRDKPLDMNALQQKTKLSKSQIQHLIQTLGSHSTQRITHQRKELVWNTIRENPTQTLTEQQIKHLLEVTQLTRKQILYLQRVFHESCVDRSALAPSTLHSLVREWLEEHEYQHDRTLLRQFAEQIGAPLSRVQSLAKRMAKMG